MRPDKNKGKTGLDAPSPGVNGRPPGGLERTDLAASLHLLKKDLNRLLAFLATYERSDHPERIEALRWLQPVLDRHLRVLARHRRNAEQTRGDAR